MRSAGYKNINTMFTSVERMAKSGDDKYDAPFLYFALGRLSRIYGQSMRFIMCSLMKEALGRHPVYGKHVENIRREFEKMTAGGNNGNKD